MAAVFVDFPIFM